MASRAATQLHRLKQSMRSLDKNSPEFTKALALKAELQHQVNLESSEANTLTEEILADRLSEYLGEFGDDGLIAEKRAAFNAARTNAYPGSEADPRLLKAKAEYEAVVQEADDLKQVATARAKKERREQFLDRRAEQAVAIQGRHDDQQLQEQHDKAVAAEFYPEAALIKKKLNTPYEKRPWAEKVVEEATREAADQIDNTPGVRNVGKVVADNKEQQAKWDESKVYRP